MNRAAAYAANAPLMGVPGASAPPGGVGEWFRGAGGLRSPPQRRMLAARAQ